MKNLLAPELHLYFLLQNVKKKKLWLLRHQIIFLRRNLLDLPGYLMVAPSAINMIKTQLLTTGIIDATTFQNYFFFKSPNMVIWSTGNNYAILIQFGTTFWPNMVINRRAHRITTSYQYLWRIIHEFHENLSFRHVLFHE